jgi:TolA-binding protein
VATQFAKEADAQRALLRVASLKEEAGAWDEAVDVYDELLLRYSGGEREVDALRARALTLYRLGLFKESLQDFERIVKDFPDTPAAEQAFFMRAWCALLLGDARRAVQINQQFLNTRTNSVWTPDVMFWLGEYHYNNGAAREAETIFDQLARRFPGHSLSDAALYWAGRSAAEQNEYRRAMTYYNDLTRLYTNSARIADARFAQGDALSELGEFSGAILAYDDILRRYPGSYLADRALGRKGDCQFTLGPDRPERYQEALASYHALLNSPTATTELKLQAEFKIGRCHEKLGRRAEAFEYYMKVVYSWLAEREAGRSHDPIWFTRAAFSAAALKETDRQWDEALRIYQRVADAAVAASPDAEKQIRKLRAEAAAASR